MEVTKNLFPQLPENSKVWIYQCSRELSDTEVRQIKSQVDEFVRQWTSHSRQVIASGDVVYNRFIVLAADETAFTVSGCSIDSSIGFIRQIENQFGIQLFDRLTVAYREGNQIKTADQKSFQQMIGNGEVGENTLVFNNLVSTLKEFREKWEVPLADSWHKRVFTLPV